MFRPSSSRSGDSARNLNAQRQTKSATPLSSIPGRAAQGDRLKKQLQLLTETIVS
jgi:hypothetical protein